MSLEQVKIGVREQIKINREKIEQFREQIKKLEAQGFTTDMLRRELSKAEARTDALEKIL